MKLINRFINTLPLEKLKELVNTDFKPEVVNGTFRTSNPFPYVDGHRYKIVYAIHCLLKKGIKLFQPKSLDFHLLELTDLNITVGDYNQPFETIIIDLPEDYRKTKETEYGIPESVIITHHKHLNVIIVTIFKEKYISFGLCLEGKDTIIADAIKERSNIHDNNPVFISALNACLLIDEYGCKRIGPENQSYYDRLQKQEQTARKRNDQKSIDRAIQAKRSV